MATGPVGGEPPLDVWTTGIVMNMKSHSNASATLKTLKCGRATNEFVHDFDSVQISRGD
jgi:hypothetical protein